MFWFMFTLWVGTFALSQVLADKAAKAQLQDEKAKTLEELGIPSNDATRPIPRVIGTQRVRSPQLLWHGNYRTSANTTEVNTSLFSSKNVVTGYNYYLSMQLGLCKGPVALRKIWYGDTLVWEGYADSVTDISIPPTKATTALGQQHDTRYEPSGAIRFYPGSETQVVDPYLAEYQDPCPGYRGLAYVVLDAYIGQTGTLQGWSFEVQAVTNELGLPEATYDLLYSGTDTPDAEIVGSSWGLKFVLADSKRIDYIRVMGKRAPGGGLLWLDGKIYYLALVTIANDGGGKPGTTKLVQITTGYNDWNSEATVDWIYFYIGGLFLEAGTYYLTFGGTRIPSPGITLAAKSGESDTNTSEMSGGVWVPQPYLTQMEVYGWEETVGTSVLADANPLNVAHDILVNEMGFDAADIDAVGLAAAATTLLGEGQAMGLLLQQSTPASSLLAIIEHQIDGHFYLDPTTGEWKVQLIRDDYDIETIVELNDDNVLAVKNYSTGEWLSTFNLVQLQFTNRENDYAPASAVAIDHANAQIQGRRVKASPVQMRGVSTPQLANRLAWRDLKALAVPLCKAEVEVSRSLWNLHIGQPVLFNVTAIGAAKAMRISSISQGGEDNGPITLGLAQDIFTGGDSVLPAPSSGWTPDSSGLIPFVEYRVEEMPYAVLRRQADTTASRLLTAAAATGRGEADYDIYADGSLVGDGALTPRGLLFDAISATATTVEMTTDVRASTFPALTDLDIGSNLSGLILVDDELMGVRASVVADYGLTLTVYRGLCDTVPVAHAEGVDVWMIAAGWGSSRVASVRASTVGVQLVPKTSAGEVDLADVTPEVVVLADRDLRPYPPLNLELNTASFPAEVDIDGGVVVEFTRRDYRIYDEVSQLAVDAETLDPTFPAADSTQYRLRLLEDDVVVWTGTYNGGTASLPVSLVKIIRACGGCPTALTFAVTARHTLDAVQYEATQDLEHEATVASVLLDDTYLGVMDTGQTSEAWTAPTTGDYDFTLSAALASDLQAKVNGGAWQVVIAAGLTTGALTGVTVADTIEVRHTDSASSDEVLLTIDAPTTDADAYAVLVFENVYWEIGGFGSLGFGTGKFGR